MQSWIKQQQLQYELNNIAIDWSNELEYARVKERSKAELGLNWRIYFPNIFHRSWFYLNNYSIDCNWIIVHYNIFHTPIFTNLSTIFNNFWAFFNKFSASISSNFSINSIVLVSHFTQKFITTHFSTRFCNYFYSK